MYSNSATQLDAKFYASIEELSNALTNISLVMQELVDDYKELRHKEISAYRMSLRKDTYGHEPKPCLLMLIFRQRPISQKETIVGYFPDGDILNFPSLTLGKVLGQHHKHIPMSKSQDYSAKKIVRMKSIRFQHEEQRLWTITVVEKVNHLNAAAKELRKAYLAIVNLHYNIHKVGSRLEPANYHLRLPAL